MRYLLLLLLTAGLAGCSHKCEPKYFTVTTHDTPNSYTIGSYYVDEHCDTFPAYGLYDRH